MNSSYEFKILDDIKNGNIIDIAYILTLKNSDRNYKKELEYYNPCKKVIIVFNNFGYSDYNKDLCEKNYLFDLIYSYYIIFKYSLKNYPNKNILLLEDDFIWNKNINLDSHLKIISNFLKNKNNFSYNLGCLPFFGVRYNKDHSLMKLVAGAHSVIYHPDSLKKFVEKYDNCKCSIICNEKFFCNNTNYFIYKKPLTYQYWGDIKDKKEPYNKLNMDAFNINYKFAKIITNVMIKCFSLLGLDKYNENGEKNFNIFYNLFHRITSKI